MEKKYFNEVNNMRIDICFNKIYILKIGIYYEGRPKPVYHKEYFDEYENALKVYNGMIEKHYFNPFASPKSKQRMIDLHLYGIDKDGKIIHEGEKSKELILL